MTIMTGVYIIRSCNSGHVIDQPGSDLNEDPILYGHTHQGPNQVWWILLTFNGEGLYHFQPPPPFSPLKLPLALV